MGSGTIVAGVVLVVAGLMRYRKTRAQLEDWVCAGSDYDFDGAAWVGAGGVFDLYGEEFGVRGLLPGEEQQVPLPSLRSGSE